MHLGAPGRLAALDALDHVVVLHVGGGGHGHPLKVHASRAQDPPFADESGGGEGVVPPPDSATFLTIALRLFR